MHNLGTLSLRDSCSLRGRRGLEPSGKWARREFCPGAIFPVLLNCSLLAIQYCVWAFPTFIHFCTILVVNGFGKFFVEK